MCTPVYVKMDTKDQLLLSEGVCNQLRIITYYSAVSDNHQDVPDQPSPSVTIPCVRVKLLQTTRIPPLQSTNVTVQFNKDTVPPQSCDLLHHIYSTVCLYYLMTRYNYSVARKSVKMYCDVAHIVF